MCRGVLDKVDLEEATEAAQAGVYLIFKNSINQQTNFKEKAKSVLGPGWGDGSAGNSH